MIPSYLLLALLATASPPDSGALARETPDSSACVLHGRGWSVAVSAPEGWSIECRGPQTTNVQVALWPTGTSWRASPVVMSVNATATRAGESLEAFARSEALRFRTEHPTASIGVGSDLRTFDGRPALVRYYNADEFGSRDAVAYVDAGPARVTIALSSGQERVFTAHLVDFTTLVTTTTVARGALAGK
jgi:hypothetical protein